MLVLGIETSCDETAAAVVKDGRCVLSNIVSSSLRLHRRHGGIIPEIASRAHVETITYVVDSAIKKAGAKLKDIELIAVTQQPGLPGSLLVGITFAQSLALGLGIPLVDIDHLKAHLYASFLEKQSPDFPFVGLVVSGGHTSLFYVKNWRQIQLIGSTRDDAAGEAFDKVAKILKLGYPGGPLIEQLAKSGDAKKLKFSCRLGDSTFDFSFSGIKTAVLYYVKYKLNKHLGRKIKSDIAASFQKAVVDTLTKKSLEACKIKKVKSLVVGGGVAMNVYLRETLNNAAEKEGIEVFFPSSKLCLDNAVMVAGLGYQLYLRHS